MMSLLHTKVPPLEIVLGGNSFIDSLVCSGGHINIFWEDAKASFKKTKEKK